MPANEPGKNEGMMQEAPSEKTRSGVGIDLSAAGAAGR